MHFSFKQTPWTTTQIESLPSVSSLVHRNSDRILLDMEISSFVHSFRLDAISGFRYNNCTYCSQEKILKKF